MKLKAPMKPCKECGLPTDPNMGIYVCRRCRRKGTFEICPMCFGKGYVIK